jgi:hypothetical protein
MEKKKKYFVSMTDRFMSGWGRAEGKVNKLIFECDSYKEASIVAENGRMQGDMSHINIDINKPHYDIADYLAQDKTRDGSKSWYIEDYFGDR